MNHAWCTSIEKLTYWKAGNWVRCDESKGCNLTLRIHYDQMLISSNDKVLETLNMNSKIKGIYKGDVLILIICKTLQEVRKLKFQIKSDATKCFQKLGEKFSVISHKSMSKKDPMIYHDIGEIFKTVLDQHDTSIKSLPGSSQTNIPLPPNYKDFVKVCLLDPTFPQVILETQEVINADVLNIKTQFQ